MKINVIDAMALVSSAVAAELDGMGLADILVDGGTVRIYRMDVEYPARSVWCEMTLSTGGISQPIRIEVSVDQGRMVGDHNPAIRAYVAAALDFAARHEVLIAERRQLRSAITSIIAEAAIEGIDIELLSIRRLEQDLLVDNETDGWDIELRMLGFETGRIERSTHSLPVHSDAVHEIIRDLRTYLIPEQRALHQRLPGSAAA